MSYPVMACLICAVVFFTFIIHISVPEEERTTNWFLIGLRWIIYISFAAGLCAVLFFNGGAEAFCWVTGLAFGGCIMLVAQGLGAAFGGGGGGGNYRSSSRNDYDDNATIDYKPQRLEGIGWANCGVGDTSTGGKYACQDIDRMKRANPQYSYRVVERRNGKIVGTIYSC